MTKQFLFLSLIFAFVLVFTGCGKNPEKTLPSKDGKWNTAGTYTTTLSITGVADQVSSGTSAGTATFTDNTVVFTEGGSSETYNWSYSDDKITLTQGSTSAVYNVTSASSKKEVWHRDETSSQSVLGVTQTVRVVEDITLSR